MTYKRYQYWGRKDGQIQKLWTEWFPWDSDNRDPWQMRNKLKNEYKEE
jgi:hypothetical protein